MKGQIASIDLILSTLILVFIAFSLLSFIGAELKNSEAASLDGKRDRLALAAAQQLALTAGRPENWDAASMEKPGLSCGQGILCDEKISRLATLYSSDYPLARKSIGLSAYGVSILVCSPSNYSICSYNLTTQAREASRLASSRASRAEVLSTLGGSAVSVIVYAWE